MQEPRSRHDGDIEQRIRFELHGAAHSAFSSAPKSCPKARNPRPELQVMKAYERAGHWRSTLSRLATFQSLGMLADAPGPTLPHLPSGVPDKIFLLSMPACISTRAA